MLKIISLFLSLGFIFNPSSDNRLRWGQNGHRTTALVAQQHLSKKAAKEVKRILGEDSMAEVANWMDEVKSDDRYDFMSPWHYVTIPKGKTYESSEKAEEGDIITALQNAIEILKSDKKTPAQEAESLKIIIHLMGDLHQPLHVGDRDDRGGNSVRLEWFYENSNLHRVWDSNMIDQKQLSFTELAQFVGRPTKQEIKEWQGTNIVDWAHEAQTLLDQVYNIPDNKRLSYEYSYKNWETVKVQLLKGGVRLAGVLNDVFK